jgi:hypothetical protein
MKLIMQTIPNPQKCTLCNRIDTKLRRRAQEVERVTRWQREGQKFRASIDKSMDAIRSFDSELNDLYVEKNRRMNGIGASH